MQSGPSPAAQEYCRQSPCRVPPAQWEITLLENPEKKNVNCLAIDQQIRRSLLFSNATQHSMQRIRMNLIQQVPLELARPILLVQDALMVSL